MGTQLKSPLKASRLLYIAANNKNNIINFLEKYRIYCNALMYNMGLIKFTILTINTYMTIKLYKRCNPLIFTILFGLSESS